MPPKRHEIGIFMKRASGGDYNFWGQFRLHAYKSVEIGGKAGPEYYRYHFGCPVEKVVSKERELVS